MIISTAKGRACNRRIYHPPLLARFFFFIGVIYLRVRNARFFPPSAHVIRPAERLCKSFYFCWKINLRFRFIPVFLCNGQVCAVVCLNIPSRESEKRGKKKIVNWWWCCWAYHLVSTIFWLFLSLISGRLMIRLRQRVKREREPIPDCILLPFVMHIQRERERDGPIHQKRVAARRVHDHRLSRWVIQLNHSSFCCCCCCCNMAASHTQATLLPFPAVYYTHQTQHLARFSLAAGHPPPPPPTMLRSLAYERCVIITGPSTAR